MPAYNEPEVVGDLIGAMAALEYPADKLQVLLLLEADDDVTIAAAKACGESDAITILLVPPADPRTKPKACNYGLYFATGDIVTIFDAEDLPEPLQLRRVVAAFRELPDDIACVQAKLDYHNGHQNILTGWFTAEYGLWFGYLLAGHDEQHVTNPVGRHVESSAPRRARPDRRWDPFNVTEDADLGLRIAASGYHTAVIDSATLEEANSDPINWIRQRSRWYKGYLQTWLVHIRRPVKLFRTLGPRSFLRFNLVLAGTPIIAVLNLVFWLITLLWFLGQPAVVGAVSLVHLLSRAGRAGSRQRRDAVHEPDRAARRRPVRSAGGRADGAGVLADDECRRRQRGVSADPKSLVLGEDLSRPGPASQEEQTVTTADLAAANDARVVDRPPLKHWLSPSLCRLPAVGYWLQVRNGFIIGDALSRVSAAQSVLFSRDPHLAAIGFIFTPLTAMVEIPAILLEPAGRT